ncbi:heavy-metal-associated domain-containing protein [Hufsiella ginkgonis]|uniref:HMA domain-containing protein n=1 Tax=Hufsiella ginkgonis TaxID=2695274 RepID=A0A7K1XUE3_9SPHI|nr:cation transporter [Hufsiella ginkgonis]MXV14631.1 hypothetical protein [Hufsiella ginkgonis]
MKTLKISFLTLFLLITLSPVFADTKPETTTFKVYGNCGACKKHIETALKTDGVTKASWNEDTKKLTVTYDPQKIKLGQIHQKVAAAGYDTDKVRANDKAYSELDECCRYDRAPVQ